MSIKVLIAGPKGEFINYVRAVEAAGGVPVLSTDVRDAENCDALLLPGGGDISPCCYGQKNVASVAMDPERDRYEMDLLRRFTEHRKPVLGICRGLQLINVFFGGSLHQDIPGHRSVEGIDRRHAAYTERSFFSEVCGEKCIVNSSHHQSIDRLGEGLKIVQRAPDGTVEAIFHEELPVWAVQWHPERLNNEVGKGVFRTFLRHCED